MASSPENDKESSDTEHKCSLCCGCCRHCPFKESKKQEGESEDDHVPWWRYCCPPKKTQKEVKRKRRTSISFAEDKLRRLSISEAVAQLSATSNILPHHLPLTFIPDFIIYQIFEEDVFSNVPYAVTSDVVLIMVDVCGFTSLCESYWQKGKTGIEKLSNVLQGFMSALSAMLIEGGGDILNFAGDAFLVQWVPEDDTDDGIEKAAIKAYECAISLQTHQCLQRTNLDGTLKIKIGIAMGELSIWCLGNEKEFLLFVAAGPAVPNVHKAEDFCSPGDIIVGPNIYKVLNDKKVDSFKPVEIKDGYVKIIEYPKQESTEEPEPSRIQLFEKCNSEHIAKSQIFLLPALRELRSPEELQYVSELTTVTVIFISLADVKVAQPKLLDETFEIILDSVKIFEGVLNKMLLFDKGCTFLAVFGLPRHKHPNDAARGIYCAEDIIEKLSEINVKAGVAVSSGTCYCGIVGHPQRQEYTGNSVNLAARIMLIYNDQPIALNVETYHLSRHELGDNSFIELPMRRMKGIDSAGAIYAYRKQLISTKKQSITSFGIVEDSNLYGSDVVKAKMRQCVVAMADEKQRAEMKRKNLLPIIIVKGHNGSGKSYISYFTADCALASGYKFAACCAVPSLLHEPFSSISQIIRRMLKMTMLESPFDRENLIISHLSSTDYSDLYLLNHLFNCEFPVPDTVITDITYINEKITQLIKAIICKFCNNIYTLICIDNADFIDDLSWTVFLHLAEEEKVLILFNISVDFKEVNKSSSAILLKAYQNISTDILQEDIFAPLLCWYLNVIAVHTRLFLYLKEITAGKIPLLKEISLSSAILEAIEIVPLNSIDEERIKKEFFVDQFEVLKYEKPMACDLKPSVDLRKAMIPTNINDAVKESQNDLSIQDRLLLKRAAVLGADFDLHTLESISKGMKRTEVLESVGNLLSKHIFSSACVLENRIQVISSEVPTISIDCKNICFCFSVYLKDELKHLDASHWPIGPYHRLKFRTHVFRSCMLGYMTKDQIYSMRVEAADNLELSGTECATCRSSRTEGMDDKDARKYSTIFKDCMCLVKRPRIYFEISHLNSLLGMIFQPIYFKRKAAQAANNLNFPVQALCYIKMVSEELPQYWLMSDEEKPEEEAYFDPLVLDISIKKTIAEANLLLGNAYQAVSFASQTMELLGIDYVCFYGAFRPKEFKKILSKMKLLHAESLIKLIGVLVKAHVQTQDYNAARDLLKFEYHSLKSYPIDFVQVLNHMSTMYKFKYLVHETKYLKDLEKNIYKLCKKRLSSFDQLVDLTEIIAIGDTYATLVEVNFVLGEFDKAKNAASEALRILTLSNYQGILPLIRILLHHIHFHLGEYDNCCIVIFDLFKMSTVISSRKYRALSICCLSMFLTKSVVGIPKTEISLNYDKCNTFATAWRSEYSRVLPKELNFYISVVMSWWSLYADKHTAWINGKAVFRDCYQLAKSYQSIISWSQFDYWTITGLMLLLRLQINLIKQPFEDISEEKEVVEEELEYLKSKIRTHYPLYSDDYKKLVTEIETME